MDEAGSTGPGRGGGVGKRLDEGVDAVLEFVLEMFQNVFGMDDLVLLSGLEQLHRT